MYSASWTFSNNLKRSISAFQPCADFPYLDEDEVQITGWWDPIHKKVKGESGHFQMMPVNPTYHIPTDHSDYGSYTHDSPDHLQDVTHLLDPYNLVGQQQLKSGKFVDPDLFFESSPEMSPPQEMYSEYFGDTSSTYTSPVQTSPSYMSPTISSPQQTDMLSESHYDPELQYQDRVGEVFSHMNCEPVRLDNADTWVDKISLANSHLIKVTDKVLKGEQILEQDISSLNFIERCIVKSVFDKKRHNPNKNRDRGLKREEEKQKFFFKSLLKYTEEKFFADAKKSKKTKKRQLNKGSYYEHYWGQVAEQHNIDITNFYHPGKKISVSSQSNTNAQQKLAENRRLKSINTTFIDLVLMSEKFREESIFYLENVFVQENANSRCKKIGKILEKIRVVVKQTMTKNKNLSLEDRLQKVNKSVQDYIILNNKTKLPWSNAELLEAKEFAQGVFKKQPLTASPF